MHQFACPHCGTRLRVKDRSFAGRTVKCPDCRNPVLIRADASGELIGATGAENSAAARANSARRRNLALAATVVLVAGLVVATVLYFGPGGTTVVDGPAAGTDAVAPADGPGADGPDREHVAARLTSLGRQITAYAAEHRTLPAPAPQPRLAPEQRLSWLAVLFATSNPGGVPPDAEHGWNEPANDPFVRQPIEAFQHPAIENRTGPGGHPVSHFAGIAGVGADAPLLPVEDRRAGVFGLNRTTRIEDIRDGQSDTMMVAGVQDRLDSWAANGPATIRPLSAEPYFGGPDGFGTAEQGGMSVLMADGSVRFLSSETDPRLLRRMAAMADGLPLDARVPGEPGEATPETPPVAVIEPVEPPPPVGLDTEPIDVALAPEPVFDIDAALDQPIAGFDQAQPRKISELLKLIGEMAGVPIDSSQLDVAAIERLERTTAMSLEKTTVRGLLDAAVEPAELTYSLGNGVVVLMDANPAAVE